MMKVLSWRPQAEDCNGIAQSRKKMVASLAPRMQGYEAHMEPALDCVMM